MFYHFAKWVTVFLRVLLLRVTYEGTENIPKTGGYIIASNHRSMVDPILLCHKIPRQIHFLGKAELFSNQFLRLLMSGLGVIAVDRGTGDTAAISQAEEIIRKGGLLGIFPEGTRSLDGVPLRPKSGLALIARTTGAGIVPCAVLFEGRMVLWKKVRVKYGKPISYEELGFAQDKGSASLKKVSKLVMGRIVGMLELPGEETM